MSVPLLIGSFSSKADYERKLRDQRKLLRIQAGLNQNAEKANLAVQSFVDGAKPAPEPFESIEEKISNTNQLRANAIDSLQNILSASEANNFVGTYLDTAEELVQFNRFFGDFSDKIKGIKLLTPSYLNSLWERYKATLVAGTTERGSIANVQSQVNDLSQSIFDKLDDAPFSPTERDDFAKQVEVARSAFDIDTLKRLEARVDTRVAILTRGQSRGTELEEIARQRTLEQNRIYNMLLNQLDDVRDSTDQATYNSYREDLERARSRAINGRTVRPLQNLQASWNRIAPDIFKIE